MSNAIIAITEVERNRNFHSTAFIKTNEHPCSFECTSNRPITIFHLLFSPAFLYPPTLSAIAHRVLSTAHFCHVFRLFARMARDRERKRARARMIPWYRSRDENRIHFFRLSRRVPRAVFPTSHCPTIVRVTRFFPRMPWIRLCIRRVLYFSDGWWTDDSF